MPNTKDLAGLSLEVFVFRMTLAVLVLAWHPTQGHGAGGVQWSDERLDQPVKRGCGPCMNGGHSAISSVIFDSCTCRCLAGYSGPRCQFPVGKRSGPVIHPDEQRSKVDDSDFRKYVLYRMLSGFSKKRSVNLPDGMEKLCQHKM